MMMMLFDVVFFSHIITDWQHSSQWVKLLQNDMFCLGTTQRKEIYIPVKANADKLTSAIFVPVTANKQYCTNCTQHNLYKLTSLLMLKGYLLVVLPTMSKIAQITQN